RPVFGINTWDIWGVATCTTADEAVEQALLSAP
ncbi:MAG: TIGR00725 family protein, partial [Methanomicrobiales archaeon]|nr:TIGR00725 family protein [Methanomicrobiales archaeon]